MPDRTYHEKEYHRIATLQKTVKHLSEQNRKLKTITDSDVERVAEAQWNALEAEISPDPEGRLAWGDGLPYLHARQIKVARAALSAFLEPAHSIAAGPGYESPDEPDSGDEKCPRCGNAPDEKCAEDGPGLRVNTRMCPRRRLNNQGP